MRGGYAGMATNTVVPVFSAGPIGGSSARPRTRRHVVVRTESRGRVVTDTGSRPTRREHAPPIGAPRAQHARDRRTRSIRAVGAFGAAGRLSRAWTEGAAGRRAAGTVRGSRATGHGAGSSPTAACSPSATRCAPGLARPCAYAAPGLQLRRARHVDDRRCGRPADRRAGRRPAPWTECASPYHPEFGSGQRPSRMRA